uniref:ATP synthase subunit a n=1 Tax=Pyropia kanakaensis TaxID=139729 RepID=A0A060D3I1_9RHOD|nr:ATP synthase F0 subunit 6 [Pyropia kanakaensis]AIB08144.1 ATP synthase F0 subunit 6 [Pyropia kanakaensis]AIB08202.1 ATP synthase F0 subunit 6 [Pyropia kanakaensis]
MYNINQFFFLASPLEQFEIIPILPIELFGLNISITNAALFLMLSVALSIFWFSLVIYNNKLVPRNWQSVKEIFYDITLTLVQDNLGKKGYFYFPFVFTIFTIILYCNLIGMVPYSFTVTSHIAFTFSLALSIYIGINIIGFRTHGVKFFTIFLPKGVPLFIVPLVVAIEFVSYIVKVFTISIRLFANMTSGHTLLKIIAGFVWTMISIGGIFLYLQIIPLVLLLALVGLEIGIALLQAYVFTLLTCIYLNDVLEMH